MQAVELIAIDSLPLIRPGDDLGQLVVRRLEEAEQPVRDGDVLVIAQKIVSKAEGRVVRLEDVTVSAEAAALAERSAKDPRLAQLILDESREILRVRPGLVIVVDRRGFVCANAGIDRSNVVQTGEDEDVALLPVDSDRSATQIRERIFELTGCHLGVVINDSHGRAWREGTVGVAIGLAGVPATVDRRGDVDLTGYTLQHTVIGLADELAAAASLLMGPAAEGVPAVLIRGLNLPTAEARASDLQRPRELDLFR